MIAGALEKPILTETFWLLPERALYWPAQRSLFIADLHLGKAQNFQREGIAVPATVMSADLARISRLVNQTGAEQLIVLGDFVHHRDGLTDSVTEQFKAWRGQFDSLSMAVVVGNHDNRSIPLIEHLGVQVHQYPLTIGAFYCAHDGASLTVAEDQFIFSGHIHPVLAMKQSRVGHVPLFVFSGQRAVLPAFSHFTAGQRIKPQSCIAAYAVAEGNVIKIK